MKRLNEDKEFHEAGKGWGGNFNGDWLYIIENFPVDKIDIDRLPDEIKSEAEYVVPPGNISPMSNSSTANVWK